MKETRYFYVPNASQQMELSEDEAQHAIKVLRLESGDEIFIMDGVGGFYKAELTFVSKKHCQYSILETLPQSKAWEGNVSLAIAPTKNIDRIEWMVEKCTEVGIDGITFLHCKFSERRQIRVDRIEKIVVSAAKQSRKPYFPVVADMIDFHSFINEERDGEKYICHCYNEIDKKDLFKELENTDKKSNVTILIGPEGDFSIDEVRLAISKGYQSVTLGDFRLRTETAGLIATTLAQLTKRK